MLPISHKFATRYYMPMVKALLRVEEDVIKQDFAAADTLLEATKTTRSVYFILVAFSRTLRIRPAPSISRIASGK